jgi:three-Cys-motif partner protein
MPLVLLETGNMKKNNFFEEQKEQSQIKSAIVKKYFMAWAKIISRRADKIAYIDLYAGQGVYEDGTKSTPILVLESALKDDLMNQRLTTLFNDTNSEFAKSLEIAINSIHDINKLKFKPDVTNYTVGDDVVEILKSMTLVPTLLFVDPWGYKGLTLGLIGSVIKDWGCDCIFFFNYLRINAGLSNRNFDCHIDAIFGQKRANELRQAVKGKKSYEREKLILQSLKDALKEIRGEFVISYKFLSNNKKRTSHFLIFVSKNILGYKIMKNIMAEFSTYKYQNVATFEYNPHMYTHKLFPPTPLDDLTRELINKFRGKTLSVAEIIQQHNVDTPYIDSNYKEVLLKLEQEKKINAKPSAQNRKVMNGKLTIGDNVLVSFL